MFIRLLFITIITTAVPFCAADQPKRLTDLLREQFERDTTALFKAIEQKENHLIWEMCTAETKEKIPLELFSKSVRQELLQNSRSFSVVYHYLRYFGNPDYSKSGKLDEAYIASIIKFDVDGSEKYIQCLWKFDQSLWKWQYIGMPFTFIDAPLALRFPGVPLTEKTQRPVEPPIEPKG